ncbi:uncharacterized protein P174DRAFT_455644 [Aspergillus novofumigatus IBT 16806]|uniref:Helicase ATP-binding domain-containing protein n=1 Tax=Aspergillus novofumigatus (strain IBT 16806) TaxID=1392255 RepID=A0A2I1BS82_ASPN1|nr:uncharacterized protein P174DRAFT_455644 [Aspergillus novofumigatus IBT 16806]PKX88249.1 hypothetical protein P174DRAFT_455644 [Aspergillus novofumigatus IBT 16806]
MVIRAVPGALKWETRTQLGTAIHIAAYRDIAIGISRQFLRPSTAFPHNIQEAKPAPAAMDADAEEGMDIEQWIGHIADLQATHSSHIAGMFLGFSAPGHPSILGKRKQAPWEDEAKVSRMERRHQLATMDLEAAAQRMTRRPDMQFQGVQDPAMRAIQRGESPVVAVMPTGGGKSMLFMVPAFTAPRGITIVMALPGAWHIVCAMGEPAAPNAASIVLVMPESAVSPDFQTFLNWLRWTRWLDWIMIDECHVVLNSQHDFRPQMAQLGWLVQARTQMVWWPDMTGVGRGPYQWIKSEAVVAFIQDCIRRAAGGKVIIYANIIGQVTAMAWVLGCEAYYSEQLDKAGVLVWFMGASPVITTTSALGMGVDIPNICSIIHIRTPGRYWITRRRVAGLGEMDSAVR